MGGIGGNYSEAAAEGARKRGGGFGSRVTTSKRCDVSPEDNRLPVKYRKKQADSGITWVMTLLKRESIIRSYTARPSTLATSNASKIIGHLIIRFRNYVKLFGHIPGRSVSITCSLGGDASRTITAKPVRIASSTEWRRSNRSRGRPNRAVESRARAHRRRGRSASGDRSRRRRPKQD